MTAGTASYSDISSVVNDILLNSLAVSRMANLLAPTITGRGGNGMAPTKQYRWNAVAFSEHTEETDEASLLFDKTLLATLQPKNYHARVDLTDERVATDWEGVKAAAALELGSGSSKHIDTNIATLFGTASQLGGTIGPALAGTAAGGTITWRMVTKAQALLYNKNIPVGAPLFCALHPYVWEVLLSSNSIAAATVAVAPGYQDRMTSSGGFFQIPAFMGITFVVTNAIAVAGTAAYGAMYVPQAFVIDTRKPFEIEPQRDASKQALELNASFWYGVGVADPDMAVLIQTNCSTPS